MADDDTHAHVRQRRRLGADMMQNTFILVVALLGAAVVAQAQQAREGHRIGVLLYDGAPPGLHEAFREGLHELGYVEGKHLTLEWRNARGSTEQLAVLADALVRLKVDLILAVNTPAALAAKKATSTIPIVITRVANPVESGLVASLARPGGNVTGVSSMHVELSAKRVELLREILPGLSRVVVLFNADNPGQTPQITELELTSSRLGLEFLPLPVRGPSDFPGAFQAATQARAEALFVLDDTTVTQHRAEILKLAAHHALPVVSRYKEYVEAGGLMAYGPTLLPVYRRTAYYVDRILKGATPSDLPIEQPMHLDLVINLKTAQALGLTIPPSLLFQATEVIR
ncbi:MAG: ABC transporter substrate-binding protein [Candidatus Entotheonellia bacterium]